MDAYENHDTARRIAMTWQERALERCRVILAGSIERNDSAKSLS